MNPPLDSEYHQQTDTEYHEQVDNSILVDNVPARYQLETWDKILPQG